MTFPDLLKSRGRNASQAAREMNIEASIVYRWAKGETTPTGENLQKLLRWAAGSMSLDEALANKDRPAIDSAPAAVEEPEKGAAA